MQIINSKGKLQGKLIDVLKVLSLLPMPTFKDNRATIAYKNKIHPIINIAQAIEQSINFDTSPDYPSLFGAVADVGINGYIGRHKNEISIPDQLMTMLGILSNVDIFPMTYAKARNDKCFYPSPKELEIASKKANFTVAEICSYSNEKWIQIGDYTVMLEPLIIPVEKIEDLIKNIKLEDYNAKIALMLGMRVDDKNIMAVIGLVELQKDGVHHVISRVNIPIIKMIGILSVRIGGGVIVLGN